MRPWVLLGAALLVVVALMASAAAAEEGTAPALRGAANDDGDGPCRYYAMICIGSCHSKSLSCLRINNSTYHGCGCGKAEPAYGKGALP